MNFVIINKDKPGSGALRQQVRSQHLAWLDAHLSQLVEVGPQINAEGEACGSALVITAENPAAARVFADSDPYAQAGLFASSEIFTYRPTYRANQKIS